MNYKEAYKELKNEIVNKGYHELNEFALNQDIPKPNRVCDIRNKCGSCVHYKYVDGKRLTLCECTKRLDKRGKRMLKTRTDKACKYYEVRDDVELIYEYVLGNLAKDIRKKKL